MGNKIAHLDMIQAIINRLANNSFLLKGWSITIITAFLAFLSDRGSVAYVSIAFFPALTFWILDGYFLHQERLFRKLYDKVRTIKEEDIDFSMNVATVRIQAPSWPRCIFSKTLLIFHGMVIALTFTIVFSKAL